MTALLQYPRPQFFDGNGDPLNGGQLFVYQAGTSTKLDTYSDSGLTTPNSNPIELQADGRPATDIFLPVGNYKFVLTDSTDSDPPTSPIWTVDNYAISATESFSGGIELASDSVRSYHPINNQTGTSYTILTGDRAKTLSISNTSAVAIALPQANNTTFADGWYIYVQNRNTGLVTITPTTSTIDGLTSLVLGKDEGVLIVSDATNYFTVRTAKSQFVNAQTGTTYTFVTGDRAKLVTFSNTSAIAGTLPQAGTSFPSGWFIDVENRNSGVLTITPTTSTIDGASSVSLQKDQGIRIFSDGTNYFTQRGSSNGRVPLQTVTASAASQVDITSGITSTYKRYEIDCIACTVSTDGAHISLRVSTDGGSSFKSGASDYSVQASYITASNGANTIGDNNATATNQIRIASDVGNASGEHFSGRVVLDDPSNSTIFPNVESKFSVINAQGDSQTDFSSSHYKGAVGAINAIRILPNSGTISGTFKLYGVL